MPNFDDFERFLVAVMASEDPDADIPVTALAIERLSESNKAQVVKHQPIEELEKFLWRAHKALRDQFPGPTSFAYSPNNQEGKDLLEDNSGQPVELKSGSAMTDANLGLAIVAWSLDGDLDALKEIMSGSMRARRSMALDRNVEDGAIERNKSATMDRLFDYFQELLVAGEPPPERLAHLARCVSVGITTGREIQACFGDGTGVALPLKLRTDWEKGLVVYEKAFLPRERLVVERLERTGERTQVILRGVTSGRTATLYPNYKNSWRAPDGVKVPASNWVQTPCFHVWID